MDSVAVNLPYVKIVLDLGYLLRDDAVRGSPNLVVRRSIVVIGELLPVATFDQGNDSSWGFGGASMVLTAGARATRVSCDLARRVEGRERD